MDNDLKQYIEAQTEKLAAMVAEGFASTATKHEVSDLRTEMNERFEQVNQRFDNVEARLGRRYQEIDELRDRLRLIETRVEHLEAVHR